jgi:anti-anti-sigma factor
VRRTGLAGELDVVSVGRAAERLVSEAVNCEVLEVDLSRVTFVDACGVRALVAGQRAMHHIGGRIRFVGAPQKVAHVLHLTGVDLAAG